MSITFSQSEHHVIYLQYCYLDFEQIYEVNLFVKYKMPNRKLFNVPKFVVALINCLLGIFC